MSNNFSRITDGQNETGGRFFNATYGFPFRGNLTELKEDIARFSFPKSIELYIDTTSGYVCINDYGLEGKTKMPYPNQIAFLDYITETDGYKNRQYELVEENWLGTLPDWTISSYLGGKRDVS